MLPAVDAPDHLDWSWQVEAQVVPVDDDEDVDYDSDRESLLVYLPELGKRRI